MDYSIVDLNRAVSIISKGGTEKVKLGNVTAYKVDYPKRAIIRVDIKLPEKEDK